MFIHNQDFTGVPRLLGLRIWHCRCCGSGYRCGAGLIPDPGTSTCQGLRPKKKKKDFTKLLKTHVYNLLIAIVAALPVSHRLNTWIVIQTRVFWEWQMPNELGSWNNNRKLDQPRQTGTYDSPCWNRTHLVFGCVLNTSYEFTRLILRPHEAGITLIFQMSILWCV